MFKEIIQFEKQLGLENLVGVVEMLDTFSQTSLIWKPL